MDLDCKIRRAEFINRTVEIREQLSFAHSSQVLKAVQVYSSDAYGSMLCQLNSESSEKFFRSSGGLFCQRLFKPQKSSYFKVSILFFQKPLLQSKQRSTAPCSHCVQRYPESVIEGERWRFGLLKIRRTKSICLEDSQKITAILNFLCNSLWLDRKVIYS